MSDSHVLNHLIANVRDQSEAARDRESGRQGLRVSLEQRLTPSVAMDREVHVFAPE